MIVVWLPAAIADLDLAVTYLEERNPDVAYRFAADIVQAGNSLEHFPDRAGRERSEGRAN